MSEAKHSTGRWFFTERHDVMPDKPYFAYGIGNGAGHIGYVYAGMIPHEEALGNARLIAAAPELLEACRAAACGAHHPACPIARGKGQTTITHDDCTCHVGKVRAAISKATQP